MRNKTSFVLAGLLLLGLLRTAGQVASNVTFTKITTGAIVNDGGSSYGCAWGDYDGDGFIDLIVGNGWGHLNFLYHNNRDGTFTRITTGAITTDIGDTGGVVWGDYDNDGWPDLFIVNYAPYRDALHRNNHDGTFTKITSGPHVNDNGNGLTAAWVDYDRDGWLDLFVANSLDENDFLYHGNGDGTFTKITSGPVVTSPGTSIGAAWGDYDDDGWPDLVVGNSHNFSAAPVGSPQNDFLFHNARDGTFARIQSGPVVTDNLFSGATAWADYDNDGRLDLLMIVTNGLPTGHRLYHNAGAGNFDLITNSILTQGLVGGCAWGDYDNDGWLDVFLGSSFGHHNYLYHNRGDGTFELVTNQTIVADGGNSLGCAWGDYNNDGFLDLFVANAGSNPDVYGESNNYLYRNDGNTNHWLMLKLLGRASNRSAIGAKVRLKASIGGRTFWQTREISGGSGYCSQNDMRAHFGLGDATNAEIVHIDWPSGTVQELRNVPANQILTVKEPPVLTALGRDVSGAFRLMMKGGRGLPYTVESSTNLVNWNHLTSFGATNTFTSLSDSAAGTSPQRFYRVREDD